METRKEGYYPDSAGITKYLTKNPELGAYLMKLGSERAAQLRPENSKTWRVRKSTEPIIKTHRTRSRVINSTEIGWFLSRPRQIYVFEVDLSEKEYRKPIIRGMQRWGKKFTESEKTEAKSRRKARPTNKRGTN